MKNDYKLANYLLPDSNFHTFELVFDTPRFVYRKNLSMFVKLTNKYFSLLVSAIKSHVHTPSIVHSFHGILTPDALINPLCLSGLATCDSDVKKQLTEQMDFVKKKYFRVYGFYTDYVLKGDVIVIRGHPRPAKEAGGQRNSKVWRS